MRPSAIFLTPPGRKAGKYLRPLNLVLAAIIGLAGCGAQQLQKMARGEIQAPKVTFQDLKIYQPAGQGWPFKAVLLLQNPNPQALNLLGYDYQLWIEGQSVAQGASQEPVNLPPQGQTVAELPILVQVPAVLELLPRLLPRQISGKPAQPGKFHYEIAGSFRLASVLGGIIPIPFHFRGEGSLREGRNFLKPLLR
jgi:hypothetical protein